MKYARLLLGAILTFLLPGSVAAQAQTGATRITIRTNAQVPSSLAVVNAGKRATVLVDTPEANGSAFCVHESGVFVTNAHVVEGFSKVKVVIFPGEPEQRIVTARVSHYDDERDIAVLIADPPLKTQVPDISPLKALPIGDSNTLVETMPLTVFGFPFGTDLALDEHEMPDVTVTTGRVTSLRKIRGTLKEIQLDAATNPGNSGGPVLNERGEVVGIIHAGIDGAQGVNFAIPTDDLREVLKTAEVHFEIPRIRRVQQYEDQAFDVQIIPFTLFGGSSDTNYSVDFEVGMEGGPWRELKVARVNPTAGDPSVKFHVTGPFFTPRELVAQYRLTVRLNGKTIATREDIIEMTGASAGFGNNPGGFGNNPIRPPFGGNPNTTRPTVPVQNPANGHWYQCVNAPTPLDWAGAKAAAVALSHKGLKGHLVTISSEAENQFVTGLLGGVRTLNGTVWIGGEQKPESVEPDGGWRWVTGEPWKYGNWAAGEPNDAGNEDVLQMHNDGSWNDANGGTVCYAYVVEFEPPSGPVVSQPIDTPEVEGNKTTITLPDSASAVVAGSGGRFLLLYLKTEQKIAVFDAQTKKIARYIPAPGADVLIAASQEKLVILLTDQNILQRWDLATGQREQSFPLPDDKAITSMAMGAASDGPLLLARGNEFSFLDLATFKTVPMTDAQTGKPLEVPKANNSTVSAAPDGSEFAFASGGQLWLLARQGNQLTKYTVPGVGSAPLPSFDGRWWFTGNGIFTGEGKPVVANQLHDETAPYSYQTMIPAYNPTYFVALKNHPTNTWGVVNRSQQMELTIYSANDRRALASMGVVEELSINSPYGDNRRGSLPLEKRVYYLPDRNLLVSIGSRMDQLVIRSLDFKQLLVQNGGKFFFVTSLPPRKIARGTLLKYQLDVQSQAGGTKYSVESGPPGLTITSTGLIQWKVPPDFVESEITVLVNLSDLSGQEIYHPFKVQIQ